LRGTRDWRFRRTAGSTGGDGALGGGGTALGGAALGGGIAFGGGTALGGASAGGSWLSGRIAGGGGGGGGGGRGRQRLPTDGCAWLPGAARAGAFTDASIAATAACSSCSCLRLVSAPLPAPLFHLSQLRAMLGAGYITAQLMEDLQCIVGVTKASI